MPPAIKTWSTPYVLEEKRKINCSLCGETRFRPLLDCGEFTFVRCVSCGLVQQNPQPSASAVASRYREHHGNDYLDYELANETSFLHLQELALGDIGFESLSVGKGLDVGCATGALLDSLRLRGWEVKGVELCESSAEYARTKRGLDVRSLPIEDAAFPNESFDLVHASHLIEHLNDPRSFVVEARRVLRPRGSLLIATPNIDGFQARLFGASWRSAIFDHLYLFSKKTLKALLEREGFRVERTVTWGGLAAGTAPNLLKTFADRTVKRIGAGDVMMIHAIRL
ncbi:MAG: class I SAM-dependent methyltransferase [Treponemataceae bacterium]